MLTDSDQAATAAEILAIIALVDGDLNRPRIEQVLAFAGQLDVHDTWLDDLTKSLDADLGPIIADMGDKNLRSATDGRLNMSDIGDVNDWLMPYEGDNADDHLGDRYRELSSLPPGTLGYEFWSFYDRHGFAFPGQPGAVGTPHDCTHVISDRGLQTSGDTFGAEFDLWHHADEPLAAVRQAFEVPPLDEVQAASSNGAVTGVDYHPIA